MSAWADAELGSAAIVHAAAGRGACQTLAAGLRSEKRAGSTGNKRADAEGQDCLQPWSEAFAKEINPAAAAAAG